MDEGNAKIHYELLHLVSPNESRTSYPIALPRCLIYYFSYENPTLYMRYYQAWEVSLGSGGEYGLVAFYNVEINRE